MPWELSQEPCISHDVHQVDKEISHIKECALSMNCEIWRSMFSFILNYMVFFDDGDGVMVYSLLTHCVSERICGLCEN